MLKDSIQVIKAQNENAITIDGFKGNGVNSLFMNTLHDVFKFALRLPQVSVEPFLSIADDGELVIEWKHDDKKAVVSFEGDNHFGYALYQNGKFVPGAEDGSLANKNLPQDLIEYLEKM